MKLQKYKAYKQSEINWIGNIPDAWNLLPIRGLCETGRGRVISNLDIGANEGKYPVYSSQTSNNGEMGRLNSYDFNGEYVTWTTDGANAGTVFYRNEKFNCTNVCGTLKKRSNNKIMMTYLPYVLNQCTKYYVRYDINPKLMNDVMARIRIPVPPLQTQQKISDFLDTKTAQIEKLIKKDKKLIELMKERRVSMINNAVTKGLDENVKMKDSGVEWIGEIPENWEVRKISQCFNLIGSGTTPTSGDETYHENGNINWLLTGDLNDGNIIKTSKKITIKAMRDYSALKLHPENSLVIAMYGATIGKIGLTKIKTTTNQACCVLNKSNIFDMKFVFYWFLAKKKEIISLSYGGGQPNISQDIIKFLKVQTPKIEEQQEIVEFLDRETVKIDKHIKKVERRIELYEEYKKSLIYNVVTGKVEV